MSYIVLSFLRNKAEKWISHCMTSDTHTRGYKSSTVLPISPLVHSQLQFIASKPCWQWIIRMLYFTVLLYFTRCPSCFKATQGALQAMGCLHHCVHFETRLNPNLHYWKDIILKLNQTERQRSAVHSLGTETPLQGRRDRSSASVPLPLGFIYIAGMMVRNLLPWWHRWRASLGVGLPVNPQPGYLFEVAAPYWSLPSCYVVFSLSA